MTHYQPKVLGNIMLDVYLLLQYLQSNYSGFEIGKSEKTS